MHRRHGWSLTAGTSLVAFWLGYGCILNGNDEGATAPPWFVDLTIALAAMVVVSMIAVVAYHVRLRRMPLAVLTEAAPLAKNHPHGPHSHHYPPRHLVTWVLRWIGMVVILIVAVVSVPAVVDGTAYLTGDRRRRRPGAGPNDQAGAQLASAPAAAERGGARLDRLTSQPRLKIYVMVYVHEPPFPLHGHVGNQADESDESHK